MQTRIQVLSYITLIYNSVLFLWTHGWSLCWTVLSLSEFSNGEMQIFLIKIWDIRIHTAAYAHVESGCLFQGPGGSHSMSVIGMRERDSSMWIWLLYCWKFWDEKGKANWRINNRLDLEWLLNFVWKALVCCIKHCEGQRWLSQVLGNLYFSRAYFLDHELEMDWSNHILIQTILNRNA